MSIKSIIEKNADRYVGELIELLGIASISADSNYKSDVEKAAIWTENALKNIGCTRTEIFKTSGHPIVYGEIVHNPQLPTILAYGHYDVQPAEPLHLWTSPPFEPVIKDGKIYARGSADDKGQFMMHLKAVEALSEQGALPCNVKFLIEGEEEIGSPSLGDFVKANRELLKSDTLLISDTSMLSLDNPSITVGLRGLAYVEVTLTGPNKDLHSGVYGGAMVNPINALTKMIAQLIDENGRITIPHFYDDVAELSVADREAMAKAPFDEKAFMHEIGVDYVTGENGYSTLERKSIRPTLDVNGIWGGYTGEGSKTVIASKAQAKISMRLVPNQNPEKISQLFADYFKSIAPKGTVAEVSFHHGGKPAVTSTQSEAYKSAERAYEVVWGKTPIPMREGGSIPIVALFEEVLQVPVLLLGFGLDSDAIHSPNESYGLLNFKLGIETIAEFHKQFAK